MPDIWHFLDSRWQSCNFENLLVFGFPETSQNLMSFRQLSFSLFHGGTKGKNLKTPKSVKYPASISKKPVPLVFATHIFHRLYCFNVFFLSFYRGISSQQQIIVLKMLARSYTRNSLKNTKTAIKQKRQQTSKMRR